MMVYRIENLVYVALLNFPWIYNGFIIKIVKFTLETLQRNHLALFKKFCAVFQRK